MDNISISAQGQRVIDISTDCEPISLKTCPLGWTWQINKQKQEKILTHRVSDKSATNNAYLAWLPFEFVQKNAVGMLVAAC